MWGRGWGMGGVDGCLLPYIHCKDKGRLSPFVSFFISFLSFFFYQNTKWWKTLWFSMSCTECTSSCMQYFGALTDLSSFVQFPYSSKHNASFFTFNLHKKKEGKKKGKEKKERKPAVTNYTQQIRCCWKSSDDDFCLQQKHLTNF